jgi:hypothetical protein
MEFKQLDGRSYTIYLPSYLVTMQSLENKSYLHQQAYKLLRKVYPLYEICQEIPVRTNEIIYLDLFVPLLMLGLEIQGMQHYKFVPFFHGNKNEFLKAQQRDKNKKLWCEINNIKLIELRYDESITEWTTKIKQD